MSSDDSDTGGGRLRRRPQGFRPLPRPSLSSGSVGQSIPELPELNEVHGSAPSNELTRIATSSHSAGLGGENAPSNDPRNIFFVGTVLTESPVSSPSPSDDQRPFSLGLRPPRGPLPRPRPVKKSSLLSNISSSASDLATIDEPPSPSRRRWDDLRHHFLPSRASDIQSSSTPPPAFFAPPRPSTPKQFRMPKLGFRQVVEQAPEALVDQITRFGDDILRASRAVRSAEPKAQRREREGTLATVATSFNMSFMNSNASLGLGTPTSNSLPPSRAKAVRRPPSLQSMSVSHSPSAAPASLCTVISYYASITPSQQDSTIVLPHESEVLSTLLLPFVSVRREKDVNEQLQAMEAFETIVKTWRAASEVAFLERCVWCCKVARITQDKTGARMKALVALSTYLFSSAGLFAAGSFVHLQTLFQSLFSLQVSLLAEGDPEGASYVRELIDGVRKVGRKEGLGSSMLVQKYEVQLVSEADTQAILEFAVIMALAACLESAMQGEHRYILHHLAEMKESGFGDIVSSHHSPDLMRIKSLCVAHCSHALLSFLPSSDGAQRSLEDHHLVFRTLTESLVPMAHNLVHDEVFDCKVVSARLALNILRLSGKETGIASLIGEWYHGHDQWRTAFEAAIQTMVKEDDWQTVVTLLTALMERLPNELRLPAATKFLPALNEKLVLDPPPLPFPEFTELLEIVSQKLPKLFYKPLFACAAGTKTSSVLDHLRTVAMLARYLPSFWIRDAEMLLVVIMSDSRSTDQDPQGDVGPQWGQVRLGQLAILIELIAHVRSERHGKDAQTISTPAFLTQARFFFAFEHRLGAFLDGKERTLLIPGSLKPAQWLSRVMSWILSSEEDTRAAQSNIITIHEALTDIYGSLQRWSPTLRKHESVFLLSPSASLDGGLSPTHPPAITPPPFLTFFARGRHLESFFKGLLSNSLRLLVAVSGLLSKEDHESLCPFLWQSCLTQASSEIQASATFLIMQCAEKAPTAVLNLIKADIKSSEAPIRLLAARRLSLISGWRFQMLSQEYLVDKNYRRPFKYAPTPVSFMPTDIGSSSFVFREDSEKGSVVNGRVLPLELRKRLADIGWTQDENPTDQKREWIMTPFSLFSMQQLEKLDAGLPTSVTSSSSQHGTHESPSPPLAEQRSLSSSSSPHGVKRRSIFVPTLASILPDLAALAYDTDHTVANASRVTVMDLMRHDPTLITRPAFDVLSTGETSFQFVFSVLRRYIYTHSTLPPAMAHHLFNHLAGFLKFSARQGEGEDTLMRFAYTVPLLSKLVSQVSDMSLRELRRAKVDIFLIPSGSLWFSSPTPTGPMFPRSLGEITSSSEVATLHRLGRVVLVRVAQNLLFMNMLKRNRQEVQAIRKNMSRLVLPTTADADQRSSDPLSFLPKKERTTYFKTTLGANTSALSLLLSRCHVLLVTEIFRSLPRHLNDRSELAVIIDGLNEILLVHGDDIGIVAHVLIGEAIVAFGRSLTHSALALMTASARFHRLFTSGGGYTLFISVLFKVYSESESNEGVRLAIEYCINRFYAVHQEAFVFQALNVLSHIVMLPEVDGPWVAKQIFLLLSTLKDHSPVHAADAAGIHGSNKTQEQEALMVRTAEEKPQAFLALLRRGSGSQGENVGIMVPDQYEGSNLALDNFVRLLLTVIGHNPNIRRAEQFLRLLRLMAPHIYESSPAARNVLQEGISALSTIFISRSAGKPKSAENPQISGDETSNVFSQAAAASIDLFEAAKSPSDFVEMRLDYLSLVAEFTKCGGYFGPVALGRIFGLVRIMFKESDPVEGERVASFLGSFTRNVLVRGSSNLQLKQVLTFLNELAPILKAYAADADFSGVLEVVVQLAEDPVYANQPAFSLIVVTHFCAAGLEVYERLALEGPTFFTPFQHALVRLLCRATLLAGADVVSLIEQRHLTFEFVAGILYPMTLNLPTAAEVASDTRWMVESWRRTATIRTSICLLHLAMQACQRQGPASDKVEKSSQPERSRSEKRKKGFVKRSPAATLSIALQTLKVIVLRAEDDISKFSPGIWVQMGSLLKSVLSVGSARFAVRNEGVSMPPSPTEPFATLKPRPSEDSDPFRSLSPHINPSRPQSPLPLSSPQPSLIDYLLWSMLEFVCRRRSSLMLQMRLFLQETTATLNEELRAQQALPVRDRRLSYASAFSKPRGKSGYWSRTPSPDASPFLAPVRPNYEDVLLTPPKLERKPGYARSPTTPGGSGVAEPRIVHLGPVDNFDMFRRSPSPGLWETGAKSRRWLMANSTSIKSAKLVLATYRRIRAVQQIMGYTELITVPDSVDGNEDDVRVWSRGRALRAIESETADLMEEFWESTTEDQG
ncbi:hypothetical protein EDB92DRAFT_2013926 [Lactarius akahatsu]|uniref:Protein UNC80 C-terminal domain-containing protein n=1 Tax=Lactarius akahatsu TaxID=416441 RepID=A0AAD4Q8Y5_9AGAM|nr:hypothetical protein EDB92DRAFT_2013926 [Lactarius akahatsu]